MRADGAPLRLQVIGPAPGVPVDYELSPGQRLILGRESQCDVMVPGDPQVSRRHLEIVVEASQIEVRLLPPQTAPRG